MSWALRSIIIWAAGLALFILIILIIRPQDANKTTDAIIVLTGGGERIEQGLTLFASGKASHLFVSGVHPGVTVKDIENKWRSDVSLPPCCISIGDEARSTQQNAEETKIWLARHNYSSIRLVTANFHMNRSLIEFKNAMPEIEIIPHPIVQPDATPGKLWFWIISSIEYHKTLVRWASMIFSPTPPPEPDDHQGHDHNHDHEYDHE